jgi:hypothetical protein
MIVPINIQTKKKLDGKASTSMGALTAAAVKILNIAIRSEKVTGQSRIKAVQLVELLGSVEQGCTLAHVYGNLPLAYQLIDIHLQKHEHRE